jgi:DNA-binding PadR family transcriptional regulator
VRVDPSSYDRDISQYVGDRSATADAGHREDTHMGHRKNPWELRFDQHGWGGPPRGPGGPPPWVQGLLGWGGQTGSAPPPSGGPRARRGDVRLAILSALADAADRGEPVNGYQVIQQIADRSNGTWRPSPGSVYPTIQQLADEGLVETDDERGRKTLRLTAEGGRYVAERADELEAVWAPFERAQQRSSTGTSGDLKSEIGQVMSAVWQIVTQGSDTQRKAAIGVLVETRRSLYGILADGTEPEPEPDEDL